MQNRGPHSVLIDNYDILETYRVELHDAKYGRLDRVHIIIMGFMASEGRKRIIDLMSTGRRNAVRAGKHMGTPPFAYRRHPSERGVRLIVAERKQDAEDIFLDCAAGIGARTIARQLNERGVPSPRECARIDNMRTPGKKKYLWTPRQVMLIIRNAMYMGVLLYGRTAVQNDPEVPGTAKRQIRHPDDIELQEEPDLQIVDPKLWVAANLAIAERSFGYGSEGTRGKVHLLTPVATCGICGARMNVFSNYGWRVYRCTAAHFNVRQCEGLRAIRVDLCEKAVLETVRNSTVFAVEDDADFRRRLQAACDEHNARQKLEVKQLRVEIDRMDTLLHKSMMQSLTAGLSGERVEQFRKEQELQIGRLRRREAELASELSPDEGLERLATMRDVLDELIKMIPFKPMTSEHQKMAIALRRLVPSVVFGAPDANGRRQLQVTIDRLRVIDNQVARLCVDDKMVVNVFVDTVEARAFPTWSDSKFFGGRDSLELGNERFCARIDLEAQHVARPFLRFA